MGCNPNFVSHDQTVKCRGKKVDAPKEVSGQRDSAKEVAAIAVQIQLTAEKSHLRNVVMGECQPQSNTLRVRSSEFDALEGAPALGLERLVDLSLASSQASSQFFEIMCRNSG